jgi:hypothetical protein
LSDLGTGTYQGYEGGLYPGGAGRPPDAYLQWGIMRAGAVVPRALDGTPNANGKIVLLSIGMSNTTQEYSEFKRQADLDRKKNPKVTIVDGAQGGQDAHIIRDPNAPFWSNVDSRLTAAGVSSQQVQVAWLKEAIAGENRPFPTDARGLQGDLDAILRIMQQRYPNLQIVYMASRTYAGYATTTLNPEPYAYQSGFAVKWLIQSRMLSGAAVDPYLAWGPYLWADGLVPRSDGLQWLCSDFQTDGTHPSTTGRQKVAAMLLRFFETDETATPWFVAP